MIKKAFLLFLFLAPFLTVAQSPLRPLKLDHPRDTMKSFLSNMNNYRIHKKEDKSKAKRFLEEAVRTLNFPDKNIIKQDSQKTLSAIYLKEVIDRVIIIDFNKIPANSNILSWRLKGTEIIISKVKEGDQTGQFLFSLQTVKRSKEFYEKVKHLPYLKGSGMGALYKDPIAEKIFPPYLKTKTLGLKNWQWLGLLISLFLGIFIKFFSQFFISLVRKTSFLKKPLTKDLFQALENPAGWVIASGFWSFSLYLFQLEGPFLNIFSVLVKIVFSVSCIWVLYNLVNIISKVLLKISEKTENEIDDKLVPFAAKVLRIFVIAFGSLLTLQNLGVNVVSLMAGLGLGGLAFALAAKDTAANLFGSIMILFDQPFSQGDWISTGDVEGTVIDIGFRSTRVQTFYNSIVTVPNSQLANQSIDNMQKRQYRRVKTYLAVTYDTKPEKLERFVEGIKSIIKNHPNTRKDYFLVAFNKYNDSSLDILLYFFFEKLNYTEEIKEKESVFMSILKLAEKESVEFAFPTRTLHLHQETKPNL